MLAVLMALVCFRQNDDGIAVIVEQGRVFGSDGPLSFGKEPGCQERPVARKVIQMVRANPMSVITMVRFCLAS